jgi:hypothetical protein
MEVEGFLVGHRRPGFGRPIVCGHRGGFPGGGAVSEGARLLWGPGR